LLPDNSDGIYDVAIVCIAWLCEWNPSSSIFQCLTLIFILANDINKKFWSLQETSILWSTSKIAEISIKLKFLHSSRYTHLNWTRLLQDGLILHTGYFCFYTRLVKLSHCRISLLTVTSSCKFNAQVSD
jgi:hypothetical protein